MQRPISFGKKSKNKEHFRMSFAAVVIGALRDNICKRRPWVHRQRTEFSLFENDRTLHRIDRSVTKHLGKVKISAWLHQLRCVFPFSRPILDKSFIHSD